MCAMNVIYVLTIGQNAFIAFQRMHNACRMITKTQSIDAMRKIQRHLIKQRCNVYVSASKMDTFAASDVKIARHFVQRERAVNAARIERPIRFVCAFWQIVGDPLVAFIHDFFEYYILKMMQKDSLFSLNRLRWMVIGNYGLLTLNK